MFTAKESRTGQQFSAWNLPYSDHMSLLPLEQKNSLPYFSPPKSTVTPNVENLCRLSTDKPNAVGGFSKLIPPSWNVPYLTGNRCLKDSHFALPNGLGVSDKPIDPSCATKKRFLIFDQSGNNTRLFFSPSFSPQNQMIASKTPANNANGLFGKVASRIDQQFLVKPLVEEKWDENHLIDEEGEMLEDTEEIDALLYSDSDDEYDDDDDDDDGENDEVTSTRQIRASIKEGCEKDKLPEELIEEVASCDTSPKRQRLHDGRYKKSSLVSVESPVKRASSCSYNSNVGSKYAGSRNSRDDIDSSRREKKVKIREALKILESIIPGLKTNDPLSVIEKGIIYLESMKIEAEALGLISPECESATFP
ncbi:hypothetical protein CDL12_26998 [Handroanthus impetiginosus]|uniref:BHLH domain-containing protein n=1 Tax=Handroanthus impetiginosus TaxID=429701 RepID=A0A2G9G5A0_9LAMI|nr:hypothetical protein CDL12_26998 [Handroanthus impetiginosus]